MVGGQALEADGRQVLLSPPGREAQGTGQELVGPLVVPWPGEAES